MNVVVYCSSVDNLPADWQKAARETGEWIGINNATLVYGGVRKGLMQIVAQAASRAGAQVVGVVPARRFNDASMLNHVKVPTGDLNDRKATMQILGDIFVVLPGGYGTLDEFVGTFSYLNFTRQRRPIIVLNSGNLYDPILQQLERMAAVGLMPRTNLDLITEVTTTAELLAALTRAAKQLKSK